MSKIKKKAIEENNFSIALAVSLLKQC